MANRSQHYEQFDTMSSWFSAGAGMYESCIECVSALAVFPYAALRVAMATRAACKACIRTRALSKAVYGPGNGLNPKKRGRQ